MALQPNLQTHFFAHFPLKERYLPDKFSTFIRKNMDFPDLSPTEAEINAYYRCWKRNNMFFGTWKMYPNISLKNDILPMTGKKYFNVLQYAKSVFWRYVYHLYLSKIQDFNKNPEKDIAAKIALERIILLLNKEDGVYSTSQFLRKNPYFIHHSINWFDLNHKNCAAESIAELNYYFFLKDLTLNENKTNASAICIRECDVLFDFLNENTHNSLPDAFFYSVNELAFNAFEAMESFLITADKITKIKTVEMYLNKSLKIWMQLRNTKGRDGYNILKKIMHLNNVCLQNSIYRHKYDNIHERLFTIRRLPSIQDEIIHCCHSEGNVDFSLYSKVNGAIAILHVFKISRLLINEHLKFVDIEKTNRKALKCEHSQKEIKNFLDKIAESSIYLEFSRNKELIASALKGEKNIPEIKISYINLFSFFLYVICEEPSKVFDIKDYSSCNQEIIKSIKSFLDDNKVFKSKSYLNSVKWISYFSKILSNKEMNLDSIEAKKKLIDLYKFTFEGKNMSK